MKLALFSFFAEPTAMLRKKDDYSSAISFELSIMSRGVASERLKKWAFFILN